MDRRDFLGSVAAASAAAYLPFSPAPELEVSDGPVSKYLDYGHMDWLDCKLILTNERNKRVWSPPIIQVNQGFEDFPIVLSSFCRVYNKKMYFKAVQFVDKDGLSFFKPQSINLRIENNTFRCNYTMERP